MALERINMITQEELNDIADINSKCQRLHMMPPAKIELQLDVFGADGEHKKEIKQLSKSWNRNFYNWMFSQMTGVPSRINSETTYKAGSLALMDASGSETSSLYSSICAYKSSSSSTIGCDLTSYIGSSGKSDQGIVIGTGTEAESFEGYTLGTLIANGTGSGQMSYAAQEATTMSYDSGTKVMIATLIRYFNNNSGGVINVSEVGWYVYYRPSIMVSRDLQSPTVAVADADQLKVTYTISVTFPA